MSTMKKWIASVALATTVVGGGVTLAAVGLPGSAGAQGTPAPATVARANPLAGVIDGLVADGTLTRAQGDKVLEAIQAKAGALRDKAGAARDRVGGQDRGRKILEHGREVFASAAEVIGITPEQLKTELAAGKSLAQIAQDHDMTADQLVSALTAKAKVKVDAAVASGKLTAEQGQKILDAAAKRLPELVQQVPGRRRPK